MKTFEVTMEVTGTERYDVTAETEGEAIRLVVSGEAGRPFVTELAFGDVDSIEEMED